MWQSFTKMFSSNWKYQSEENLLQLFAHFAHQPSLLSHPPERDTQSLDHLYSGMSIWLRQILWWMWWYRPGLVVSQRTLNIYCFIEIRMWEAEQFSSSFVMFSSNISLSIKYRTNQFSFPFGFHGYVICNLYCWIQQQLDPRNISFYF